MTSVKLFAIYLAGCPRKKDCITMESGATFIPRLDLTCRVSVQGEGLGQTTSALRMMEASGQIGFFCFLHKHFIYFELELHIDSLYCHFDIFALYYV